MQTPPRTPRTPRLSLRPTSPFLDPFTWAPPVPQSRPPLPDSPASTLARTSGISAFQLRTAETARKACVDLMDFSNIKTGSPSFGTFASEPFASLNKKPSRSQLNQVYTTTLEPSPPINKPRSVSGKRTTPTLKHSQKSAPNLSKRYHSGATSRTLSSKPVARTPSPLLPHEENSSMEDSFWRWSKSASTIYSDATSSHFYFNKRSTGQYSSENDYRGSRETPPPPQVPEIPNNLKPSSRINSNLTSTTSETQSRTSGGTFGVKQRRWSASNSHASHIDPFGGEYPRESDEHQYQHHQQQHQGDLHTQTPNFAASPRRRPRSMSSASDLSSAYILADSTFGTQSKPLGGPSPLTQKMVKHQTTEKETFNRLVHASSRNVQSQSQSQSQPIITKAKPLPAPPSLGTPIKSRVQEETNYRDSWESDVVQIKQKRLGSKLDQILGEGAETARVLMEFERRAVKENTQPSTPGPVPPRHKSTASVPTNLLPPVTSTPDFTSYLPSLDSRDSTSHRRSMSMDSLPSLNPSLSDSINTLSRLLPSVTQDSPGSSMLTRSSSGRKDLTPTQRAILLRRTRKLESRLGETLPESHVGSFIVDPVTSSSTTILKSVTNDWPATPLHQPEWDRQDVVPRTIQNDTPPPIPTGRVPTKLAERAKAALRLGMSSRETESDLRVYVEREERVSETNTREDPLRLGIQYELQKSPVIREMPTSPTLTIDFMRDEQDMRRVRRQQLAKLHRLLGVPIPPSLLDQALGSSSDLPKQLAPSLRTNSSTSPSTNLITPKLPDSPSFSFMAFDDPDSRANKLASKIKNSLNGGRDRTTMPPKENSFIDLREFGAAPSVRSVSGSQLGPAARLTDREKSTARRKAAKLEQKFGTAPPQGMYIPKPIDFSASPGSPIFSEACDQPYDGYERSLQNLLYLAENDKAQLANIVDSLDNNDLQKAISHSPTIDSSNGRYPGPGSPSSPIIGFGSDRSGSLRSQASIATITTDYDPHSHSARRHRASKLSQFFGEQRIDIDNPDSVVPSPVDRAKRRTRRRETLDNVLSEMWKGVQLDAQRGGMGEHEYRRLGDMMGAIKSRSGWVWEES